MLARDDSSLSYAQVYLNLFLLVEDAARAQRCTPSEIAQLRQCMRDVWVAGEDDDGIDEFTYTDLSRRVRQLLGPHL